VVFGALAITYNINGVHSLSLDGSTAAKIFNGAVARWNDPAIQVLNSRVTLPAEPIHVVFRSHASGTTDNFQQYLDAASNGAWGKGAGSAPTRSVRRFPGPRSRDRVTTWCSTPSPSTGRRSPAPTRS
jgi:ABC-type phosphate transport system substrate-binding protein